MTFCQDLLSSPLHKVCILRHRGSTDRSRSPPGNQYHTCSILSMLVPYRRQRTVRRGQGFLGSSSTLQGNQHRTGILVTCLLPVVFLSVLWRHQDLFPHHTVRSHLRGLAEGLNSRSLRGSRSLQRTWVRPVDRTTSLGRRRTGCSSRYIRGWSWSSSSLPCSASRSSSCNYFLKAMLIWQEEASHSVSWIGEMSGQQSLQKWTRLGVASVFSLWQNSDEEAIDILVALSFFAN